FAGGVRCGTGLARRGENGERYDGNLARRTTERHESSPSLKARLTIGTSSLAACNWLSGHGIVTKVLRWEVDVRDRVRKPSSSGGTDRPGRVARAAEKGRPLSTPVILRRLRETR